jgi:hypothetical protein
MSLPSSGATSAWYLLQTDFLVDPEDGREIFLGNVTSLSTDYMELYPRR